MWPTMSTALILPAFHHRARMAAAHNFTMPAMSPTMTEGNIASWKVKEGTHAFPPHDAAPYTPIRRLILDWGRAA